MDAIAPQAGSNGRDAPWWSMTSPESCRQSISFTATCDTEGVEAWVDSKDDGTLYLKWNVVKQNFHGTARITLLADDAPGVRTRLASA